MSPIRKLLVVCLTISLLLTPLSVYAAEADGGSVGSAASDDASYVRIKNQWKGTYLYEADGQARYGFTAPNDPASQWLLVDAGDGLARIENRATGRSLDMASVIPPDKITAPLETTAATNDVVSALWRVREAAGQPGCVNVVSSEFATRLLNVQTQDGFAHANDWAQPSWGSALWQLEPASDLAPVRLVDQWKGNYLYEDGGKVKYGQPAMNDASSQWYVQELPNGHVRLQNRATGHFLNAQNVIASDRVTDPLESTEAAEDLLPAQWVLSESAEHPGYFGIAGADDPTRLLNVQSQDGYAHANNWAQPGWGSALWKLETASDAIPVRLKDQWKGKYLFEKDGIVQYGEPANADKSSWWLVENRGAGVTLRNVDTGRYAAGGSDPVATVDSPGEAGAIWAQVPAKDGNGGSVDGYFTFAMGGDSSALLNVQAQDGNAHANDWAQPAWGSAQWKLENPSETGGPEEPQSPYIRIRNDWLQLYLYEEDGIVKYGNAAPGDASSQWLVVDAEGGKRIQNRATGHFLNLEGVSGSRDAVRATELPEGSTRGDWVIEDYQGFKLIRLAGEAGEDPTGPSYLNVENKLKVLQYGVVPRDWGSPKWEFIRVDEKEASYVRLKNGYRGTYLYEQNGIVKDGAPDAADPASHWLLKPGGQGTLIVNRATGHLVTNEHVASHEDPLQSLEIDPTWGSVQWTVESVEGTSKKVFRSVWKPDVIIHDEDNKGFAQASGIPADWGSAQWELEAAPELPAELPDGFVRIQNRESGQYLYENSRNVVLYGTPDAKDATSNWSFAEDEDGKLHIANRATGNVLSIEHGRSYLETSAATAEAGGGAAEWTVESASASGYILIRSAADGHEDEYVHAADGLGYAQYGLRSVESGAAQWKLEAAPDEAVVPPADDGDLNGETPALADPNFVRIVSAKSGQLLAERNGAIAYVQAGSNDLAAQWRVETYNGRKRLKNRSTGHYVSAAASGDSLVAVASGKELAAQWKAVDVLGYKTLANAAASGGLIVQMAGGAAPKLSATASIKDEAAHWTFAPVAGDVRYGAEEAFATGGVSLPAGAEAHAAGFAAEGAQLQWSVYAATERTAKGSVAYRNASGSAKTLSLYVNGLKTGTVSFPAAAGSSGSVVRTDLALRAGMNTVALRFDKGDSGGIELGALTVADSVRGEARGATVPYVTYEAEHAATNGTRIGGDRAYGTFSAESSGREAVRLGEKGQYVEFRAAEAANFLNVRYIIPDSQDGAGQEATLSVYVNGEDRGDLVLSSKHSWVYGKYPFSNNPADGDAHRFYDEAHRFVGDIPAGATVRLQKDEGDAADYYVLDLVELERAPSAFAKPAGYKSVVEFGAAPDDGKDDSAAFRAAITAAETEGFGLWIPEGEFELSGGPLEVRGVTLRGAGMWYTKLRGEGFMGVGSGVRAYDLAIDIGATGRHDERAESAFDGAFGTGSAIQNVWIEHAKAGIWTTLSGDLAVNTDGLYVGGVRIRNTYADGIHLSTGTRNSLVEQSAIRNSGDDSIALWSDPREGTTPEQARTENNAIRFNTVQLPWLADNVAVFGGKDNRVTDNVLADTMGFGAGIAVSTRFNPVPFSGTTRVERNTLLRTGGREANWNQDFGAIWLFTGDKPIDADIVIADNEALDSTFQGLYVSGPNPINASGEHKVTIRNLVIDGTGTWGLNVANGVAGSVELVNALVRNTKVGRSFSTMGDSFKFNVVEGCQDCGGGGEEPGQGPGPGTGSGSGPGTGSGSNPDSGSGSGSAEKPTDLVAENDKALADAVAASAERIVVKADEDAGEGVASFTAGALREAARALPTAMLAVEYRNASFELPLKAAAADMFKLTGAGEAGSNAVLRLSISPVEGAKLQPLASRLGEGLSLVSSEDSKGSKGSKGAKGAEGSVYRIRAVLSDGDKATEISHFESFQPSLTLALNGELEERETVALAYEEATSVFRPVPALIDPRDGRSVVAIRSLTTGTFLLAHAEPKTFADVAGHWARRDIELLASKRIANGLTADRFAPDSLVTRAEFAALLARALGLAGGGAAPARFGDVPDAAWYASDVYAAAGHGLVQGDADGSFRPSADITREQMAVLLARSLRLAPERAPGAGATPLSASRPLSGFADADRVAPWARDAVETLLASGVLTGRSSGSLAPQGFATRAEAVVLIARTLQAMELLNK
ncbi:hypothetical protein J19TS2_52740 [Cohnella xylanilytica]|uniref:RICIN domain-containing protein n=1 Tax=Cohnella xylanilytica TaxID=557555 RepID=UPI001B09FB50|nr:S-layer homology domain-containing protein [Cohnella xylanilytica]GIO15719.1 hypothetical protein J19TS2_52740 [Cohnella xylanilytica]